MMILITIILLLIPLIFLFNRDLLIKKQSFYIIFIFCILLLIISFVIKDSLIKTMPSLDIKSVLRVPLISLILFRLLTWIFYKIFNRYPQDTYWINESLWFDTLFNILFWITGILIPVIFVFRH
jgi:hypothetical protein